MAKELLARGQATITTLSDAYTITQSVSDYIFPATSDGKILEAVTVVTEIKVTQNNLAVTAFSIWGIAQTAGFSAISVNNATKSVTFTVAAGTTTLADHGKVNIPVIVAGVSYYLSFIWAKAKAGAPGADATQLDWVKEWNTGKTQINENTVITPKLFAGIKNADGTLTGTAIGCFDVSSKTPSGTLSTETVNGISGFRDGYKTFFLDNGGNAQLGRGEQFVRYNAATGKVEFGAGVSLLWAGATYIDKDGIFTGTLSATTVAALHLDAAQITSGTISAQRIDTAALQASLITAGNIEALTLNVIRGKIGGWFIDSDSIYSGTKNNTPGAYTAAPGAVTIGSQGLRGCKWRLESTGAGALAGGNIAWDTAGNVTFASAVSMQWSAPLGAITTALGGASFPKLTKITADGIYTGSIAADQITAGTISADRIATGSLDATKLDAASIRANIINAEYVSGLNCSFAFGKIGGWAITFTSIYTSHVMLSSSDQCLMVYAADGTSNHRVKVYYNSDTDFGFLATNASGRNVVQLGSTNRIAGWSLAETAISKGNVSLGADGSITNTTKWKLANDGSGQIASGNIAWSAAGVVTFTNAVSLSWTAPIGSITSALGGASYSKLTHISSQGIYTGTLTALQVNAVNIDAGSIVTGTLAADRIAVGSITAEKLDVASIRAQIVSTDYINGLECSFVQGTIGGWRISSGAISGAYIHPNGPLMMSFNSIPTGTGSWNTGCKPMGTMLSWYVPGNAGHLIMGQVADHNKQTKDGFLGFQMMNWMEQKEYFCLSANYVVNGKSEVYNRIAGWTFDDKQIGKNNVLLASDGSIVNRGRWQLNNDGSGHIASGNILWNSAGQVSFSDSVSLSWKNDMQSVLDSGKIYARGIGLYSDNRLIVVNGKTITEDADEGLQIIVLDRDNLSVISNSLYCTYSDNVEIESMANAIYKLPQNKIVVVTSYGFTSIGGTLSRALEWCGCSDLHYDDAYCFAMIGIPGIGRNNGLTVCFDDMYTPAELSTSIICGIPQGVNANSSQRTYIDASGVYTGTVSASQIRVNSALVVGGKTYNGSISVRDSADTVKVTLDRSGITAVAGKIGGWVINEETICAAAPESGHRVLLASNGYMYNDNTLTQRDYWALKPDGSATFGYGKIEFLKDGSGFLAGGKLSWDAQGNLTGKNATLQDIFMTGTFRSPFVGYDGSIIVGGGMSEAEMHDNITMPGGGGFILSSDFPWDIGQNGRTVTVANYKYNGSSTSGKMSFSAPMGKYFFEDGLLKSSITLSRECVVLKGYGERSTFYGWIVIHRSDIGTTSKYGSCSKVMYQGWVENGSLIRYKSFDEGKLTCSRTGTGTYVVNFPSGVSIPTNHYSVMLTGSNIVADTANPLFASLTKRNNTNFTVKTADDTTANNGSFTFQVISMADWIVP